MNVELVIEKVFGTTVGVMRLIKRRSFIRKRLEYKKRCNGSIAILANGPSLRKILPYLKSGKEFKNMDFSVHNFFGLTDEFFKIKPKFYALADPMFIKKNHRYDEVVNLFDILQNKVDWDMTLYIPFDINDFLLYSKITNNHILIKHVEINDVNSWEKINIWLYTHGMASPFIGSVVQLNIFAAINEGFKEIHLYGVDHTMICNLVLNADNQLCNKYEHFSDANIPNIAPIIKSDGKVFTVSEFLLLNYKLFRSHEQLRKYAEYHHSKIVNYTEGSMIDSYERKK